MAWQPVSKLRWVDRVTVTCGSGSMTAVANGVTTAAVTTRQSMTRTGLESHRSGVYFMVPAVTICSWKIAGHLCVVAVLNHDC